MSIDEVLADFIRKIVRAELDSRQPNEDDRPLTVEEAAAEIGVSSKTVRRWIASGKLPAAIIGKRYRIERDALSKMSEPATIREDAEALAARLLGS